MTEKMPKLTWVPYEGPTSDGAHATTVATLADLTLYAGPGLASVEDDGCVRARNNPGTDGDERTMQRLAEEMAASVLVRRIDADTAALRSVSEVVATDLELERAYVTYLRARGPRPTATPQEPRFFGYYKTEAPNAASDEDRRLLNHVLHGLALGERVFGPLPDTVWIEGPFVAVSQADLAARALAEQHTVAGDAVATFASFCTTVRDLLPAPTLSET